MVIKRERAVFRVLLNEKIELVGNRGHRGGEGHKVSLALLTLRLSCSAKGKNKNTSEEKSLEHCPWMERLMSLGPFWMFNVSPETSLDFSP